MTATPTFLGAAPRCPRCKRFVARDGPDTFYDWLHDREEPMNYVAAFCSEAHADAHHAPHLIDVTV